MYINTSLGKIDIIEIDESTIETATETTSDWQKGEQVVLACLEGGNWRAITVNEIKYKDKDKYE